MSETLTVRRWSRFGADRLMVTGDTGERVGWIDLHSGEVVVERPVLEAGLRRAAQEYLRADVPELVLPVPRGPRDAFDASRADEIAPPTPASVRGEHGAGIGARLRRLVPEGWLVLSDVPVGRQGALLDHLLIGPGGVYTIRVHTHGGADVRVNRTSIEVGGHPTNFLRDASLEQGRVQQVLGAAAGFVVDVRAVIVLGAGAHVVPASTPDAALVLTRTDVPEVFRRVPPRLAATKVEAIRAAAGRRVTWTS